MELRFPYCRPSFMIFSEQMDSKKSQGLQLLEYVLPPFSAVEAANGLSAASYWKFQ